MREEKTGKITGGIIIKNFVRRRTDSWNAVISIINYESIVTGCVNA